MFLLLDRCFLCFNSTQGSIASIPTKKGTCQKIIQFPTLLIRALDPCLEISLSSCLTAETSAISETGSTVSDETVTAEPDDGQSGRNIKILKSRILLKLNLLVSANAPYSIRQGASQGLSLSSISVTPRLTPPDSPTRLSKPGSPRRQSIAFSNAKSAFDEKPSGFSSLPSSQHGSMTGSVDSPSPQGGRFCFIAMLNLRAHSPVGSVALVDFFFNPYMFNVRFCIRLSSVALAD